MSLRQLVGVGAAGAAAWLLWRRYATTLPADMLQAPLALSWAPGDPFGAQTGDQATAGPLSWGSWGPGGPNFIIGPGGDQASDTAPAADFTSSTEARESGDALLAKNPRSSASGLFQFTKATWEKVGGTWGPDPTKPFGGLKPSQAEQQARFDMLTAKNAAGLAANGVVATSGALYGAHVLGLPAFLRVWFAPASASLASLVGSAVMKANPQFKGFTVADFKAWIGGRG